MVVDDQEVTVRVHDVFRHVWDEGKACDSEVHQPSCLVYRVEGAETDPGNFRRRASSGGRAITLPLVTECACNDLIGRRSTGDHVFHVFVQRDGSLSTWRSCGSVFHRQKWTGAVSCTLHSRPKATGPACEVII